MSHDPGTSKKRERSPDGPDASVVSPLQQIYARFETLSSDISDFNAEYFQYTLRFEEAATRDYYRSLEVKMGMFTPNTFDPHLMIERLQLLYKQSNVLADIYALNTEINEALHSPEIKECIAERDKLMQCRETLSDHVVFVGQRTRELVNLYCKTKDSAFKSDIKRRLDAYPKLLRWVEPFFEAELNDDPLFTAVTRRAENKLKRQKLDKVEILKGAFDFEIRGELEELEKRFSQHLDVVEASDEQLENVASASYPKKVECYANYCVTVLKEILKTRETLCHLVARSDIYIAEIQKLTKPSNAIGLVKIVGLLMSWHDGLSEEVNTMYELMERLIKNHPGNEKALSPKLYAFMTPWLNALQARKLETSIAAYENFQENTQEQNNSEPTLGVNNETRPSSPRK